MKKWIFILGLLVSQSAYAGTISVQPFISGNDVTIARLETQRTTFQNVINGNIEGGNQNIKAGSITSSDLATAVNTVTFRDEAFNDWTYSGMLATTSGTLSTTISAGVSYINGVRVQTSATAHTFTASKDTYVYINAGGYFDYQEVANGAAAPATPANELLLFKAVTSGTAVTSVTDSRTTSIQITANSSNFPLDYRNEALISLDSTTAVHAEPGQIAIGNLAYSNTADTTSKSTATAANWIEGVAQPIKNMKFYVYAYNNSGTGFDIKYSSADPVYADTDLTTGGTLRYYQANSVNYRALAYISADTSSTIQGSGFAQFKDTSTANSVTLTRTDTTTSATVLPYDNTIPQSNEGGEFFAVPFKLTNINNRVKIDVNVNLANSGGSLTTIALFKDATASAFYAAGDGGVTSGRNHNFRLTTYTTLPDTNIHIFRLRAGCDVGTTTLNGEGGTAIYGGVISSNVTITEIEG